MERWRELGYDKYSVSADPKFHMTVDGILTLSQESPARRIGFEDDFLQRMKGKLQFFL